jgi:energy-coupling factor transporter ATP-binding protein EcfA2
LIAWDESASLYLNINLWGKLLQALFVKKIKNVNNPANGFARGLLVNSSNSWTLADSDSLPKQGDIFVYGNYEVDVQEKYDEGVLLYGELEEALADGSCDFSIRSSSIVTPPRGLEVALIFDLPGSINPQRALEISSPIKPSGFAFFAAINEFGSRDIIGPFEVANSLFDETDGFWHSTFRLPAESVLNGFGLEPNSVYRTDRDTIPYGHMFELPAAQSNQGSVSISLGLGEAFRVISAPSELFLDNRSLLTLLEQTLNPTSKLGRKGRRELLSQLDASTTLKPVIKEKIKEVFDQFFDERQRIIDGLKETGEIDGTLVSSTQDSPETVALNDQLQATVEDLKSQLADITLYWRREEEKNKQLEQSVRELQSDAAQNEIEKLKSENTELREKLDLNVNYDKRRWELEAVNETLEVKKDEISKLEEVKTSLNRQILADDRVFRDKALEVIPFLNVIGSSLDSTDDIGVLFSEGSDAYRSCDQELLDIVAERILEQGYKASPDFLKCVAAAAFSSRFVGVYGPPGTGKTTLARCFANALGNVENSTSFVNVGKGWTSHTDFIGYANTFIDKFKFQDLFFRQFEQDREIAQHYPPRTIILDEASLSSVDSYLSDFMSIGNGFQTLDDDHINLSGKQFVFQPDFRFLLTFNFDENTEALPRKFLDRMPLINCEEYDFEGQIELNFSKPFKPFNANSLTEYLHLAYTTPNEKSREMAEKMDVFLDDWEPLNIISRRKRMQIEQFIKLLSQCNDVDDGLVRDFISFTFLLPSIDDIGADFADKLQDAANKVGSLKARKQLEEILAVGERFQRYRYL